MCRYVRVCVCVCEYVYVWFSFLYLLDGISTLYGLFNAKIKFISKCLITIEESKRREINKGGERKGQCGLIYLFKGISTPYGLFNAKIRLISKFLITIITIFSISNSIFLNYFFLSVTNCFNIVIMAQNWAKSTRKQINYGRFINQFLTDPIKLMRQPKRINKKCIDKGCLYCLIKYVLTK